MQRLFHSKLVTDYGMALVLAGICLFLAIWTRQLGPAIAGERGANQLARLVAEHRAAQGGEAVLICPTLEQLAARTADPPLGSDGQPVPLLDIELLQERDADESLFSTVIDYSPRRREMSQALARVLESNPEIDLVVYVDQTHDRIAGIVATVAASSCSQRCSRPSALPLSRP